MKLRRTKNIVVITIAACCSFTSCYDSALDFEQNGVIMGGSVDSIAAPELAMMYMREAQQRVIDTREHKYQYQFNLHIDDYAGYMSISHNFEGRMASSFAFYSDFCGGPWANFTWTAQQVVPVMNSAEKLGIKPIGAMATILYAYSAHQLANIHGPFPFKDFRALKEDHPLTYDKVSDIYTWTFEYLDQAIATLEEYKQKPNSETDDLIEKMDIIANVTGASAIVDQWIKFSNSLRLRMAMDIVKVDGYTYKGMTAQRIAEDAVNNHGGVLKAGDPTIGIDPSKKSAGIEYHPLFTISKGWNDTRLNASLENILKRTESPLLGRWFNKNKSALTSKVGVVTPLGSEYMGIRSGVYLEDRSKDRTYKVFSDLSEITMRMSISLIKVEEVLFLQAEGALRGWNMGGTPQSFYEAGIHESFMKNGMSEPDYDAYMKFQGMGSLANAEKSKKTAYKDYYEADNDLPRWDGYFQLNNAYSSIDGNPY
ncbi:MAG: SusD/RagB family nutrient-binding outer membrane lipoprotein, partial [Bacteroides sp.]